MFAGSKSDPNAWSVAHELMKLTSLHRRAALPGPIGSASRSLELFPRAAWKCMRQIQGWLRIFFSTTTVGSWFQPGPFLLKWDHPTTWIGKHHLIIWNSQTSIYSHDQPCILAAKLFWTLGYTAWKYLNISCIDTSEKSKQMVVKWATPPATSLNSSQHLNYFYPTALVQIGTCMSKNTRPCSASDLPQTIPDLPLKSNCRCCFQPQAALVHGAGIGTLVQYPNYLNSSVRCGDTMDVLCTMTLWKSNCKGSKWHVIAEAETGACF